MSLRLVVPPGEATTVAEMLARHGAPESAVAEGRVFVGGKRARDASAPLSPGDEIVVESARKDAGEVRLVSEYRGLHAAWKPAGMPTEPDRNGDASVVHAAARLLGVTPAEIHAATRLDAQVSGLVVLARGGDAARLAASLKADGSLRRRYLAVASAAPSPAAGVWDAKVGGDPACSHYATTEFAGALASGAAPALLVIEPVTGRTHQIRLHAAVAGVPLLGDAKYGGPRRVVLPDGRAVAVPRVALHSARVDVVFGGVLAWRVTAPLAEDLAALWTILGGDAEAPRMALSRSALYEP